MSQCRSLLIDVDVPGFSKRALKLLSDGKKADFRLSFSRRDLHLTEMSAAGTRTLSISGVQDKVGLVLYKGKFLLAENSSRYILKPIPSLDRVQFREDIPANEHLTMQIAAQLCGIETAPNACVEMSDGENAYLVRRFDYRGGEKIRQEDFAQLLSRSEETHGKNYKYDCSYEEAAGVIKRFCPAYMVEMPKFFRRIVFNYLFGNGDAHLKNFSLYESPQGDYVLTLAYDLVNTSLHIPSESALALELFAGDYYTPSFEALGFYSRADFEELARRIGVGEKMANAVLDEYVELGNEVESMVARSFLSEGAKAEYVSLFKDRRNALRNRGI